MVDKGRFIQVGKRQIKRVDFINILIQVGEKIPVDQKGRLNRWGKIDQKGRLKQVGKR